MAVTFHAKHTPNAARLAIEYGAAGIIVSNHGARQLDYVPATISCLEEVRRPNPSVIQSFRVFSLNDRVFRGKKKLACASWLSMFLSAEVFTIKCDVNSGRQGSERPATGVPRRRRPPWHGRLQGPGVGSFRSVRKDDDDDAPTAC